MLLKSIIKTLSKLIVIGTKDYVLVHPKPHCTCAHTVPLVGGRCGGLDIKTRDKQKEARVYVVKIRNQNTVKEVDWYSSSQPAPTHSSPPHSCPIQT